MRATGLPVELEVAGEPVHLPPGVDAAAFRIVQEALVNVVRHAAATRALVRVDYEPEAVELVVSDDGVGGDAPIHDGRGLVNLRERVALYGGELRAGRRRPRGFELRARLPDRGARDVTIPRPRRSDLALAAALGVLIELELALSSVRDAPLAPALLLGAVLTAAMAWRSTAPLAALGAVAAAALGLAAVDTPPESLASTSILVAILSFAIGAHLPRRRAQAGLAGVLALVASSRRSAPTRRWATSSSPSSSSPAAGRWDASGAAARA